MQNRAVKAGENQLTLRSKHNMKPCNYTFRRKKKYLQFPQVQKAVNFSLTLV